MSLITLEATLSAIYTTTSSWANITGLVLPGIPVTGYYDIEAQCVTYIATGNRGTYVRLAIDGNGIPNSSLLFYSPTNSFNASINQNKEGVYLKKGQIVSLQALYLSGATAIQYDGGGQFGFIKATQRGRI